MKILSIDDSSVIRRIISETVEPLGYETLEASDGEEGLHMLSEHFEDIKLILLDRNMPGVNGLEVLKTIKDDERFTYIPIMMVTTEGERACVVEAIQEGANNYLVKPFASQDLVTKVMECLGIGLYPGSP